MRPELIYLSVDIQPYAPCVVAFMALPGPLAGANHGADPGTPVEGVEAAPASFLHLPFEIRLYIYRLALGDSTVVQPTLNDTPYWCPAPGEWRPGRHIHSDADQPSAGLRSVLECEGSVFEPWPHSRTHGCCREIFRKAMIFGNGRSINSWEDPEVAPQMRHADLMRTCRTVHDEMLDVLYAARRCASSTPRRPITSRITRAPRAYVECDMFSWL